MHALVVGSGGREHAISTKLAASPLIEDVYCAPGNAGMARDGIIVAPIPINDHDALIRLCSDEGIGLVVVGPEAALMAGIVDDLQAAGTAVFGPNAEAALIEGSKEFAKQIMEAAGVPTAKHRVFTDFLEAEAFVHATGAPIVIKADGLAAGKGVVVATTEDEAIAALRRMLLDEEFGSAGRRVVVEEFLEGEEFSLMAFVSGTDVYPMVIAQDHKRALEGDRGPNTGGMGAYSPVPQISEEMVERSVNEILKPTAARMAEVGRPFTGVLYAGLIATADGPKVIEFNARFGDPEAQVVLPRMRSDLAKVMLDVLQGVEPQVEWDEDGCCVGVVVAADGYPGSPVVGGPLPDFDAYRQTTENVGDGGAPKVYFSGVEEKNGELVSAGGRVYLVSATAKNMADAQRRVYETLNEWDTQDTFYRHDIGYRALNPGL